MILVLSTNFVDILSPRQNYLLKLWHAIILILVNAFCLNTGQGNLRLLFEGITYLCRLTFLYLVTSKCANGT